MSELFKPNLLTEKDIDDLKPWQALVAVCHYGPQMKDCVELDYGYTFDGKTIFCHVGDDAISLEEDIDISQPFHALEHYAGLEERPAFEVLSKTLLKNHMRKS
jgi:hypothetical protein